MKIRVRYAPSPTGHQHIGSARTALFNYLFAQSNNGVFVLRIEDTDRQRLKEDALEDIYRTFDWLGFHWDEGPDVGGKFGPYIQSQRKALYEEYADVLLKKDMLNMNKTLNRAKSNSIKKWKQFNYGAKCSACSLKQAILGLLSKIHRISALLKIMPEWFIHRTSVLRSFSIHQKMKPLFVILGQ